MPLKWNEMKRRATTFIKDWEHGRNEEADERISGRLLKHIDISRKKVATFEHKSKKARHICWLY
ncbi:MAG: hypothetical protein JWR18_2756 [Segetibacter sp.]|nr:hypothetical protein [Segetibacter sp.]